MTIATNLVLSSPMNDSLYFMPYSLLCKSLRIPTTFISLCTYDDTPGCKFRILDNQRETQSLYMLRNDRCIEVRMVRLKR